MSKIVYMDYFLPKKFISAEKIMDLVEDKVIPEGCSKSDYIDDFIEKTGLSTISLADEDDLLEVFVDLVSNSLKQTGIAPEKIKYIFYTNPSNLTVGNNVSIPYYIQKKFNMSKCTIVVLDQKCSTTLQSLKISKILGEIYDDEFSLILSPCFIQGNDNKKRFIEFTICGDAAGIMIVGNNGKREGFKIVDGISSSDGEFSFNSYHNALNDSNYTEVDNRINIIKKGADLINELLEKNEVSKKQLKIIIPQSVNKYAYEIYSMFLEVDSDKIFKKNIPHGGHLGDVDIIRNLKDFQLGTPLENGDYVLLYGLGSDGTDINYNAVLCKYDS